MSLVGFEASKIWRCFCSIYCRASFEIIFRQKEFPKAPLLDFQIVLHKGWKNQKSLESLGF